MSNKNHPLIRKYIGKLNRSLKHLSIHDRDDIVREIEGHIIEKWEADSNGAFDDESLRGVLGKMGTPEFIAAQYCDQRGWAKPPKNHTLRNTILIICAIIGTVILGTSYFGAKYVIYPVLDTFRGFITDSDNIVEIDDDGIRVLDGKIQVDDSGVKIDGVIEIDSDDEDGKDHVRINGIDILSSKLIAKESQKIELDASDLQILRVNNKNGYINVTGASGNKVKISYVKKVYGNDKSEAQEMLKQMKLQTETTGSELNIDDFCPYNWYNYPKGIKGIGYDIDVQLPKNVSVELDTRNGHLTVDAINGNLNLTSRSGKISANKIIGNVAISGRNGKIIASNINGKLEIDTRNGSIAADNIDGNVSTQTRNGSINIEHVSGDIDASTRSGSIKIALNKDYGFKLSASTKLGSVSTNFNTTRNGNVYEATVGDGSHKVNASAKLGSVKVRRD